jgi:RHS repeat-associated protein
MVAIPRKRYVKPLTNRATPTARLVQTTTLTYLLGDHLGSTSLAVDAANGDKVETRYKPWGEVRFTTASATLPTRYTFTGQYSYISDDATDLGTAGFGLLFYNSRWYDPALGRMAQADSIVPGGVQGFDRYAYVNNSPVRYTDPTGHKCVPVEDCENNTLPNQPDYNPADAADLERQDYLFSLMFPGSGPDGAWTLDDWEYYYEHRQELWLFPDRWINDDPAEGWAQFMLHVERLKSYYDLSDPIQRDQFVMDYGLAFAGIPSSNGVISGAWKSRGGPAVTYGYFSNGDQIPSYLHYGNEGLPEEFLDDEHAQQNQSHHYAGTFYLSYFFSPDLAKLINLIRDPSNPGDILLGNEAADDALLFYISPENLMVILTYYLPQ